jgi:hypothetical protein
MTLPPEDLVLLIKLLGMLGSDHAGERANAGKLASTLLARHKTTWSQLLNGTGSAQPPRWVEPFGLHQRVLAVLDAEDLLTQWELDFAHSLLQRSTCSPKQNAILTRLLDRARAHAKFRQRQGT